MDALAQKIRNMNLTKTEKIIADYILDNINTIGFTTVTDMSLKLGVSDTSIIRFIRSLGYAGFADFKKSINGKIVEQYNAGLSPMQKFARSRSEIRKESLITDVFYKAMDNLAASILSIDEELVTKIADCLLASRDKYIVGFRSTSCCASYFYRKAVFFLPHMHLCDSADSIAIEHIADLSDQDCVLMFSFPRYSEINPSILKLAAKRKAKVILVTDRITSPLAAYADFLLTVRIEGVGITNSYIVPLCLAEALAMELGSKTGEKDKARRDDLESLVSENKLY